MGGSNDLEIYRACGGQESRYVPTVNKRSRQSGLFLRGPIPLAWLHPVLAIRGRTPLALALALRFQSGLEKSATVRLTGKLRKRFHISRRSTSRALEQLERLGLVKVERHPGRCPVIEIVEVAATLDQKGVKLNSRETPKIRVDRPKRDTPAL